MYSIEFPELLRSMNQISRSGVFSRVKQDSPVDILPRIDVFDCIDTGRPFLTLHNGVDIALSLSLIDYGGRYRSPFSIAKQMIDGS